MKKVSLIKAVTLFLGVLLLTASLFQCTKVGDNIEHLNRSYPNTPDSTIYASFRNDFTIATADAPARINDVIKMRGVQTIIHEYCGTSNCHGGASIKPKFDTSYTDIMKLVVAGRPEQSKLWEMITTNDLNKAMPPVNSNHELTTSDKAIIFNWIYNGAKEKPDLADFRPAAIRLIVDGCGSANCHNQATATGAWIKKGFIGGINSTDTITWALLPTPSGNNGIYCQLINKTKLDTLWRNYKDSVKTFYSDTVAKATFRPFKTFSTPWVLGSPNPGIRGPLGSYDDILMDIKYPKRQRSNSSPVYLFNGNTYYVSGNYLNSTDCLIREIDSTIIYRTVYSGADNSTGGRMAYDDGGLKPSEIALIKAWYFADPNIPDIWKYGPTITGTPKAIFYYKASGKEIRR